MSGWATAFRQLGEGVGKNVADIHTELDAIY